MAEPAPLHQFVLYYSSDSEAYHVHGRPTRDRRQAWDNLLFRVRNYLSVYLDQPDFTFGAAESATPHALAETCRKHLESWCYVEHMDWPAP